MIVFVAGMPRAGSTWTYNVVRAVLEAGRTTVLPDLIPVDETELIKRALMSEVNENEAWCIKTHLALKIGSLSRHEIKIICNIRDVRDACLSIMRFMHADFEVGKRAMMNMMNVTDYYLDTFGDNLLGIRFEDLVSTPQTVVQDISDFLGVDLSGSEMRTILGRFDKSSIQKRLRAISNLESGMDGRRRDSDQQSIFDFVKKFDGTHRVYDKTTAFHSNHITSSGDGEWRTYFDEHEAAQIYDLSSAWLMKYGYEV
jgi:hypothetical protein